MQSVCMERNPRTKLADLYFCLKKATLLRTITSYGLSVTSREMGGYTKHLASNIAKLRRLDILILTRAIAKISFPSGRGCIFELHSRTHKN